VVETVSRAISAAAVMRISPAPFRGLLFSRAEQLTSGEAKGIGGGNSQKCRLILSGSRAAFAVQPNRPIYKQTGNLRAVQILLGHTKIESTVRYLGVDIEDALALAEGTEV
jgi:hypothetical protein